MHSWTPGSTCPRPAPAAAPVSRPGAPPRGYPGNKSQTILETPGWLASGHISHEEEEYLLSAGLPQKGTLAPVVPAGFFLLPVPSAEPRMLMVEKLFLFNLDVLSMVVYRRRSFETTVKIRPITGSRGLKSKS